MASLKRLVKLHLKPGKFAEFQDIFEYGKHVVTGSEGCQSVKLLQDDKNPDIAFTFSEWKNEGYLNKYRNSKEFRNYWPKIKFLLSKKTEVWNLSVIAEKTNN
ncbi:MAG: antibiotic biosynthesis monooxygenase family protein [Saprospiraceae bacterium]